MKQTKEWTREEIKEHRERYARITKKHDVVVGHGVVCAKVDEWGDVSYILPGGATFTGKGEAVSKAVLLDKMITEGLSSQPRTANKRS